MKTGPFPYHIALILLIFSCFFICGCVTMQNPEITVRDISITNISFKQMSWRADIEIYNPNSMEVTVSDLDLTISYMDGERIEKIGNGTYTSITIPAKTSKEISIPVMIDNYDIIKTILTFIKTGEMKIITNGSGRYNLMFVQNSVTFNHEMSLSMDNVESSIKDTMNELVTTAQGTKKSLDTAKNLINPVKEGVGEIINIFTNNST